jgi:hypothetical protein
MKKSQVGDAGYQGVTDGLNEKDPGVELKDCCDVSTKGEASHLAKHGEITRLDGSPKKFYSKPTLINYGTARELAKRLGPGFKWPDLFK